MSSAQYRENAYDLTRSWVCPACQNSIYTPKNDNTPLRPAASKQPGETDNSGIPMSVETSVRDGAKPGDDADNVNTAPRGGSRGQKESVDLPKYQVVLPIDPEVTNKNVNAAGSVNLEDIIKSFQNFQTIFDQLTQNLQSLSGSLLSCKEEVSDFQQQLSEMKARILQLEHYEEEVKDLREEVKVLRTELEIRDQRDLANDIEIKGIPEQPRENLQQVVKVLATKLGIALDDKDINTVGRIGKRQPVTDTSGSTSSSQPRIIVVRMTRRAPRDQLLYEGRVHRGITSDQLQVPGPAQQIYINERLTKTNRSLYGLTRSTARELNYKYVWVKNGQILLRKTERGRVYQIRNEEDLKQAMSITNFRTPQS